MSLYARIKDRFGKAVAKRQHDTTALEIEYRGKVQSLSKWKKELGVCVWKVYKLKRGGMTFQEAFDALLSGKKQKAGNSRPSAAAGPEDTPSGPEQVDVSPAA